MKSKLLIVLLFFEAFLLFPAEQVKTELTGEFDIGCLDLIKPSFLGADQEGLVYLIDHHDQRLFKLSGNEIVKQKRISGPGPGELPPAVYVAKGFNGNLIWFVDYQKNSLIIYDLEFNLLAERKLDRLTEDAGLTVFRRIIVHQVIDLESILFSTFSTPAPGNKNTRETKLLVDGRLLSMPDVFPVESKAVIYDPVVGGVKEKVTIELGKSNYLYFNVGKLIYGGHPGRNSTIDVFDRNGCKVRSVGFNLPRMKFTLEERRLIINRAKAENDSSGRTHAKYFNPVFHLPEYKPFYHVYFANSEGDILLIGMEKTHLFCMASKRIMTMAKLNEPGEVYFIARSIYIFYNDMDNDIASIKKYSLKY